jgi:hypothetical protein
MSGTFTHYSICILTFILIFSISQDSLCPTSHYDKGEKDEMKGKRKKRSYSNYFKVVHVQLWEGILLIIYLFGYLQINKVNLVHDAMKRRKEKEIQ